MGRTWGHWGTGGNIGAPAPPIIEPGGETKEGGGKKRVGREVYFTKCGMCQAHTCAYNEE